MEPSDQHAPSQVFSILHDGCIVSHEWKDDALVLTVNILYLAELLDPTFRALTVRLDGARDLRFRTWPKEDNAEPAELTSRAELTAMLTAEPDILNATWSTETRRTTVVLNQSSPTETYCGGELSFHCDRITIHDPAQKPVPIATLETVARAYWKAFATRSSTST